MKAEILKIAGVKSEKEFYKKFPTEESFMKVHGKALKKAQVGAMIQGSSSSQFNPQPINFQQLYDQNDMFITGSTQNMRNAQAQQSMLAGQQNMPNKKSGVVDAINQIGKIADDASNGAKNGKKLKKAQGGIAGVVGKVGKGLGKGVDKLGGPMAAAQAVGDVVGGIQQMRDEKQLMKQAQQMAGVSDVAFQASMTRPEQVQKKYVRPEDNINTGQEFFPIYGVGTTLAKNGTEIANTFAPNTIYTDLEEAQNGITKFAQQGGGDALSQLTAGLGNPKGYGVSGGGKLGAGVGSALGNIVGGPVGGMVGKVAGQTLGNVLDRKAEKTEQARGVVDRNITSMAFNQGTQGLQQQNYSHMRDGGMANPQVATELEGIPLTRLFAPDPTMDTLRAGGHLKSYTAPSERAMYTGRDQFAMGGNLETHWGGHAEPMSYNPYLPEGGETVMFRGRSHDESDGKGNTGIGITYGESPVEVERGEPAVQLRNGSDGDNSLTVYGNLKIPKMGAEMIGSPKATGKKFKNYVADLSKTEQKQNKLIDKSVTELNNLDVNNPYDLLKFQSYKANILGANQKLKNIADEKIKLANLQSAINDTAEEYNLVADDLAQGKVKQAKKGASIKKAQTGVTQDASGKIYEGQELPEFTVTPFDEQYPFYQSLSNEQKRYINEDSPIGRATRALAATGKRGQTASDISNVVRDVEKFGYEASGVPGTIRFAGDPVTNLTGTGKTLLDLGVTGASAFSPAGYGSLGGYNPITGEEMFNQQNLEGTFNTLDALGMGSMMAAPLIKPASAAARTVGKAAGKAVAPHMISIENVKGQVKGVADKIKTLKELEKVGMEGVPMMEGVDQVKEVRNFGKRLNEFQSKIKGAKSSELSKYYDEYNELTEKADKLQSLGEGTDYSNVLSSLNRKLNDLAGYKHDDFIEKLKNLGGDPSTVAYLQSNPDVAAQYANRTSRFSDEQIFDDLDHGYFVREVTDAINRPSRKMDNFSPYTNSIDPIVGIDPVEGTFIMNDNSRSWGSDALIQKDGKIYTKGTYGDPDKFYSYPFYKNVGDKLIDLYTSAKLSGSKILPQVESGQDATELLHTLFARDNDVVSMLRQADRYVSEADKGLFYPAGSLSGDSYPLSVSMINRMLKKDPESKLRFLGYKQSNNLGFADKMQNPQLLASELTQLVNDLEKTTGSALPKPFRHAKATEDSNVFFPTFGVSKGETNKIIDEYLKNAPISDRLGLKRSVIKVADQPSINMTPGSNILKDGGFVNIKKAQLGVTQPPTVNLQPVNVTASSLMANRNPFGPIQVPQSVINAGIKKPRQTLAQMNSWKPTLGNLPQIRPFYSPFYTPPAGQQAAQNEEGKINWMDVVNQILPYVRPTDAEALDPRQLSGEMLALATNQVDPVQMQSIQPQLTAPFDISLQDIINQNQADYRSAQRMMGYNPAAQGALNAQKYAANQKVLGEQFRMNQAMKNQVYADNRNILDQANLQNMQGMDQQYVRQQEALSNTKLTAQAALSSIASKYLQNQSENRTLQTYENMYNYRFDPRFRAGNMNPLAQFNTDISGLSYEQLQALADLKKSQTPVTTTNTTTIRNGGIVRAIKSM
jgi:hypothetical protein